MANYTRTSYSKQTQKKKKPKKTVIQIIICLIVFAVFYSFDTQEGNMAKKVNNFTEYALNHQTDFKAMYKNTIETVVETANLFFVAQEQGEIPTGTEPIQEQENNSAPTGE